MKKRLLLIALTITIVYGAKAQFFLGLRGSAYGGITNVDYNPAIADSRFLVDINLIGVAAQFNNNYIGIDHRALLHPSWFKDPNFQADNLTERVNGRSKSAYVGAQIQGPLSFMFSFGTKKNRNKNAIAFSYHANFIANVDNVNETLARIAYYGLGNKAEAATGFIGKNLNNLNLANNAAAWNDYGITYSRVVYDKKANLIKVGGTLKILQPLMGEHASVNDLNYKWPEYNTLTINKGSVNYAYSEGLVTSKGYPGTNFVQNLPSYFNSKLNNPTAAADLGVVYEWRPVKDQYTGEMDCDCQFTKDKNMYKIAAGFSIIDIGALHFNRGQYSENFNAQIANWNVGGAQFPNGLQSFDDTLHSRFQQLPTKSHFTVWLPTRFNIFVDYNIIYDFGVLFSATISPDMSPTHNMLHQVTTFTVNPKYDYKWVGVYLPLSVDVMGNVSLGTTLRLGPLVIGSADLLGFFIKKYAYNADIHAALKITIPQLSKCKKGDARFSKSARGI